MVTCQQPDRPVLLTDSDATRYPTLIDGSESLSTTTVQEQTPEEVVTKLRESDLWHAVVNLDVPGLQVFEDPDENSVVQTVLVNPGPFEGLRTLETTGRFSGDFVEVVVPVKPNNTTGWVKNEDITHHESDVFIVIDLSDRKAILFQGENVLVEAPVAIGATETPTPVLNAIVDVIWHRPDSGTDLPSIYGDRLFGLNKHSVVLDHFNGRRPALAIHSTDEPEFIGTEISNGCIRMYPEDMNFFAKHVVLGTRVSIIP